MCTLTCRTCVTPTSSQVYKLQEKATKHNKVIWEMLADVCSLDPNNALPQHLCSDCLQRLQDAYEFVLQARQANDELLAKLESSFSVEQFMDVKVEDNKPIPDTDQEELPKYTEGDSDKFDEMPLKERLQLLRKQRNCKTAESPNDPLASDLSEICDGQVKLKEWNNQADCGSQNESALVGKQYKCDQCDKSYYWPASLISHMRKHTSKSNWLTCPNCPHKFYRKDNMMAHMRNKHGAPRAYKRSGSTLPKVTELDISLCLPHGTKRIQCMLCLQNFSKIALLAKHLQAHADQADEVCVASETRREIASSFFADANNVDEAHLKQRICEYLNEQKFSPFYSITNQSGRELSLESSETDSDFEEEQRKINALASRYNCELCSLSYARKYQLFDHQRQQHDWLEAPNVCARCQARFVNAELLQQHRTRQCNNVQKLYICKYCRARFQWRQNLRTHYAVHRNKNTVVHCSLCDRTFRDARGLHTHNLSMHADKSSFMSCHWCNLKFYRRDFLLRHLQRRHGLKEQYLPLAETLLAATSQPNGQKRIACKVCDISFTKMKELRSHLLCNAAAHHSYDSALNYSITNAQGFELHLDDTDTDSDADQDEHPAAAKYTCSLCQVQCRRIYELQQHQRAMHPYDELPYACGKCIFKCAAKPLLERHERSQCLNVDKQLNCALCSYKFMWPENLQLHVRLQHATGAAGSSTPAPACESSTDLLRCPHCDRTYQLQARLRNHIRDVHSEDGPKKAKEARLFLCSQCGINLRSRGELQLHTRRHNNDKPFKCDLCKMAFVSFFELKLHRRKHTGEKPYQCTFCQKAFARSDKLRVHQATHKDKRK
ncbi:zinc finger protein 420-like [Scaptodrosophila lebanonensis]|uniref:Zinc finger protein 420-like n=1 Tax=Drosophila lebanonensis TaxID=7225 RepID=A0A6J2TS88_DROLE|nr:zinc finger protein 420-like [Scaptodrosophila lebanonensis]